MPLDQVRCLTLLSWLSYIHQVRLRHKENFKVEIKTSGIKDKDIHKILRGMYIVTFPGNATLVRSSQEVVKGSELTLTCLVPDLGRWW